MVQIYWTMGRGADSRNRVLSQEGNRRVFTEVADPSLPPKNPSLLLYDAMRSAAYERGKDAIHIVSNGMQTDGILSRIYDEDLASIMNSYTYEPDPPNCTPRITAISGWGYARIRSRYVDPYGPYLAISMLRKSEWSDACDRNFFEFNDLKKGYGYCITTYVGDGDPLPSFRGEPQLLPVGGDNINQIAEGYWKMLNPDNRVSLAVKLIPRDNEGPLVIKIINKYEKI